MLIDLTYINHLLITQFPFHTLPAVKHLVFPNDVQLFKNISLLASLLQVNLLEGRLQNVNKNIHADQTLCFHKQKRTARDSITNNVQS